MYLKELLFVLLSDCLRLCRTWLNLQHTPTLSKTYYLLYFDKIDAVCHTYGPQSDQFKEAVDSFLRMMEELLYKQLSGKTGQTLLILTADHGQVEVDPRRTFYLNKHEHATSSNI